MPKPWLRAIRLGVTGGRLEATRMWRKLQALLSRLPLKWRLRFGEFWDHAVPKRHSRGREPGAQLVIGQYNLRQNMHDRRSLDGGWRHPRSNHILDPARRDRPGGSADDLLLPHRSLNREGERDPVLFCFVRDGEGVFYRMLYFLENPRCLPSFWNLCWLFWYAVAIGSTHRT